MSAASFILRVDALLRHPDPVDVAAIASRRLIAVIHEWAPDTALSVSFLSRRGRVGVTFTPIGRPQPAWDHDVRWALSGVARLRRHTPTPEPTRTSAPVTHPPVSSSGPGTVELCAIRDTTTHINGHTGAPQAPDPTGPARLLVVDEWTERRRALPPWPQPTATDLHDLLELLANHPGLELATLLGPGTDIEEEMLWDSLQSTWTGPDDALHDYLGTPVRMRTLLRTTTGPVPAPILALLRRYGRSLHLEPVTRADDQHLLTDPARALLGHLVPEGLARSLLHLPAAGPTPRRGIPSERPPVAAVPLDPFPTTPARPVRLGTASTADGRTRDVLLDVTDFLRHLVVDGSTGTGKSTFLTAAARGLADAGCGFTILEGHGTTVDAVLDSLPAHTADTISVIRHGDRNNPVPVNILRGNPATAQRNIDTFADMIQNMYDPRGEGMVGPRWRRWFGLIAQAVHVHFGDHASLVHVAAIAGDMTRVAHLADRIAPHAPALAHQLRKEFVALPEKEATELVSWAVSKFHPLLSSEAMRDIIGTGADAIDVAALMDTEHSLLIDLGTPTLGAVNSRMLGALWLMKFMSALGERTHRDRPHVLLVDEAHLFSYGALPNILAEARKFGLGVIVATQSTDALHPQLRDALDTNASTVISFRTGLRTARHTAARLGDWPIDSLTRLPDLTAATTLSRGGIPTDPFTLTLDHHTRSTRQHWAATAEPLIPDITNRSRTTLVAPHRHRTAPTDEAITQSLIPHTPPRRPSTTAPDTPPGPLDQWLQQHRTAPRPDTAAAHPGRPTR